jgi:hypothetical protein
VTIYTWSLLFLHLWHIFFGYGFPDKKLFKKQKSGDLFTSDVLTKCWGKGHCLLGDLTFESAAYVAPDKKIFKKQKSGDLFTSDILTKCWGMGHCLVGDLTFESAAYVARSYESLQGSE